MIIMARLKAGNPRPHNTADEVCAWNKELRIKEYSPESHVCQHCAARPSKTVLLKSCGRCQRTWYCGADCQRAGWAQHKVRCNPEVVVRRVVGLQDEERAQMLEELDEWGYFVLMHATGPGVVLRDPATGDLFESLSNQDVFFLSDPRLAAALP